MANAISDGSTSGVWPSCRAAYWERIRVLKERVRVYVVYERNPRGLRRENEVERPPVLVVAGVWSISYSMGHRIGEEGHTSSVYNSTRLEDKTTPTMQ